MIVRKLPMLSVEFRVNICGPSLDGIDFEQYREKSGQREFEVDSCPSRAAIAQPIGLSDLGLFVWPAVVVVNNLELDLRECESARFWPGSCDHCHLASTPRQ
jgi:hypothetical protein